MSTMPRSNRHQGERRSVMVVAIVHIEVPAEVHQRAKAAAALAGMTLKDWLIAVMEDAATKAGVERPK